MVVAALLPIGTLSVVQALDSLDYSRTLIANRLVTSALATAGEERDTFIVAKHTLTTLSDNEEVRSMGPGCREGLKAGMLGNPALNNFARSDAQGTARCSVLPFKAPLSFAQEKWWQRGMAEKGFTVSAPVLGSISKRRVLIGMLPITDAQGRSDGAITVAINVAWLQTSLDRATKDNSAVTAVTDAAGQIILINGSTILPKFNTQGARGNIQEGVASDGTEWMYSAAPLYDKSLYIIYAEPKKQMMATALMQARIDLILPIIAILLASLALWIGTNRLVIRWLDSLRDLASQFARGDYTGDPQRCERAPRELGALCEDLHIMAQSIEARDTDLQAALAAKTVLTLDIHHRVKNNLQIVSSLLNLQSRRIEDPAAKEALDQTRARIGALAQIHRLLYEDANESAHGEVDIALLLDQLTIQLRALHRHQSNIDLICVVQPHLVPVDSAVPLSLFAVEAITNVYRHAFPADAPGSAKITYSVTDNEACLAVRDDGVGYNSGDEARSMGHQLMTAFAHQLGGKMEIVRGDGSGTTVTLIYPLAAAQHSVRHQ